MTAGQKAKLFGFCDARMSPSWANSASRKRGNFVVPSDDRIQQWIEIPEGLEFPPQRIAVDRVGAAQREVTSR